MVEQYYNHTYEELAQIVSEAPKPGRVWTIAEYEYKSDGEIIDYLFVKNYGKSCMGFVRKLFTGSDIVGFNNRVKALQRAVDELNKTLDQKNYELIVKEYDTFTMAQIPVYERRAKVMVCRA